MPNSGKSRSDIVVIGSSIASIAAALELARLGQRVSYVLGARKPGAHFAGVDSGGLAFDAGMVFFEFTSFQPQSEDVRGYDADTRSDCGRFAGVVEAFVRRFSDAREAPAPLLLFGGREYSDFLIANELGSLAKLPEPLRSEISRELEAIAASDNPLHPKGKRDESRFLSTAYEDASRANHGAAFHARIIEPVLRKLLGPLAPRLPALFHRAAWMPLFYPETLLSALQGGSPGLSPTRFHYPASGEFRSFVDNLMAAVEKEERIEVVRGEYSPSLRDAGKLVWGDSLERLEEMLALGGPEQRDDASSITLSFIAVESAVVRRTFSTLFVVDEGIPVYRVTNQNVSAGRQDAVTRLIVESDGSRENIDAPDELRKLGILGGAEIHCETKVFKNALPVPSAAGLADFARRRARVETALPGVALIGPASSYASRSLNDQIVQGLRAARIAASGG